MRIETTLELPNNIGEVIFFADLSDFSIANDGIGSYEYFGAKGYDRGSDYLHLEKIDWDNSLYSDVQNSLIWDWVNDLSGGDDCPYQKLCNVAEQPYSQKLEDDKERYDLRNV